MRTINFLGQLVILLIIFANFCFTQSPSSSKEEGFFLDLGIVIEPTTGNEKVNRVIKKPPEEVKFFIEKESSGMLFMATTQEIKETLENISTKIGAIEHALNSLEVEVHRDVESLQEKNFKLQEMVSELKISKDYWSADVIDLITVRVTENMHKPPYEEGEVKVVVSHLEVDSLLPEEDKAPKDYQSEKVNLVIINEEIVESPPGNITANEIIEFGQPKSQPKVFDRFLYMKAVFAYQRNDFNTALEQFDSLEPQAADPITAGNILYWMADCYYRLEEFDSALQKLQAIRTNLLSDKIDDSVVLEGLIYRSMGNEEKAIASFSQIVEKYPGSEYFQLAELELKKDLK